MRRALMLLAPLAASTAGATTHPLPFSYPYATLTAGALEIEQYTDLTPVPAIGVTGAQVTTPQGVLTTEIEYGLTDHLELGLYFQLSDDPGGGSGGGWPLNFDGIKQRLRYRFAEAGQWPVDLSIYGEVSELQTEIELEGKINLEKRIGRWQWMVNLWGERELYYSGEQEWVANPTAGGTYEITPAVHLGVEYWMHAEFGASDLAPEFNSEAHHYLGPALELESTRFWVAVAPYLRLDRLGRAPAVGDQYGPVWVRTIIGIDL